VEAEGYKLESWVAVVIKALHIVAMRMRAPPKICSKKSTALNNPIKPSQADPP